MSINAQTGLVLSSAIVGAQAMLFTGAGASVPLNLPTTKGFLRAFGEFLERQRAIEGNLSGTYRGDGEIIASQALIDRSRIYGMSYNEVRNEYMSVLGRLGVKADLAGC